MGGGKSVGEVFARGFGEGGREYIGGERLYFGGDVVGGGERGIRRIGWEVEFEDVGVFVELWGE